MWRETWVVAALLIGFVQPSAAGEVPFVPTPSAVVDEMLELANVGPNDVIYDLGSGDGRIVITAAKRYGARGVGVDIDPQRVKEARENAKHRGVADRVDFREGDLFDVDLSEATVVTLYLLPEVNMRLRPKLWSELKPGTRVVSHSFNMGDWEPLQTRKVMGSTVYYWVIPEQPKAQGAENSPR
jgi:SAM-dependent methyltransferase